MIEWPFAVSVFRDVRPDQDGFQPSFLYVALCLLCPLVLGVLFAALSGLIGRRAGRNKGKGESGV